jgi:hypothetical protein
VDITLGTNRYASRVAGAVTDALIAAADSDSSAYLAGRIFADVLLIGIPVCLLIAGWRRERSGRSAAGFYIAGGVLLMLVVMGMVGRAASS